MRAIFADTSYWIALTNVQDNAHEKAKSLILSLQPSMLLTSEQILTEYLNYFAAWGADFRHRVSANVGDILVSQTMKVVPHTTETFMSGLDLYRARLDKGYSLTDCISMQIMRREGLIEVLTGDRHFEQEGFHALLRS